jgi:thymidylate synthase (FAD)
MQVEVDLLYFNQKNPNLAKRWVRLLKEPEDIIEFAGRWDYGQRSINKMTDDKSIIQRWIGTGEESMIEMGDATFFVQCSRVVSHEFVRHRLASFQQESQRFTNYSEEEPELLYYHDPAITGDAAEADWDDAISTAHDRYLSLLASGVPKQLARYVLPNATRTRMIVKANLREWRHILRLRMHTSAQPEMRLVARKIHDLLVPIYPNAMADVLPAVEAGERKAR